MKQNKLPTLSIGIPAYNEEQNIGFLLKSILSQKRNNFKLENIYVACDGCTDNTVTVVKSFKKQFKNIVIFDRPKRLGKAQALNLIYEKNQSDFILSIDADLVFIHKDDINLLAKELSRDQELNYVGPRHIPYPAHTWMGKFAVVSYLSFEDAFLKIRNGNCIYASMGAYLIKKEFSKTIKYKKTAQADQTILYALATKENKNAFKLVVKAAVYFRTVSTFYDWRVLGTRSVIRDKENTAKYVGKDILKDYYMPKRLFISSLIKWFFKDPVLTTGSVLMNIYIRKFPLMSKMPKNGLWEIATTSKAAIITAHISESFKGGF